MIGEGNLKRYFLYGIGEILLVVIGILIALQINNWNLKRINKKTEIEILEGIVEHIHKDSVDINFNITAYKRVIRNDSILYNHLTFKKEYSAWIVLLIAGSTYNDYNLTLHKSFFEQAKQRGLGIISNKELRNKISKFYEFDYESLLKAENSSEYFNYRGILYPALSGYVETNPNIPIDSSNLITISEEKYNQLLLDKNAHFKILLALRLKKQLLEQIYLPIQMESQNLVDEINQELKRLKK